MKGINHLVLCARRLDAIRQLYGDLGFTLCPPGQHPFGTGNTIIQLHGSYLELLAVTRPQDVVEHSAGAFSFSAFNRDYLSRHEGFSMLVLDSDDALRDRREWNEAGLTTYEPFQFSRTAHMVDGSEVIVGFSLAFVSNKAAPWLGLFACEHFLPEYYSQASFQTHANGAHRLDDVWISGRGALELESYLEWFLERIPSGTALAGSTCPPASGRSFSRSQPSSRLPSACRRPTLKTVPTWLD